jgi:hypothetical protein
VTAPQGSSIVNTATVDSDGNDPTPGNSSGSATVLIGPGVGASIPAVPTASGWALLMLAMILGVLAVTRLRF